MSDGKSWIEGGAFLRIHFIQRLSNALIAMGLEVELHRPGKQLAPREPVFLGELFRCVKERIGNGDGSFQVVSLILRDEVG